MEKSMCLFVGGILDGRYYQVNDRMDMFKYDVHEKTTPKKIDGTSVNCATFETKYYVRVGKVFRPKEECRFDASLGKYVHIETEELKKIYEHSSLIWQWRLPFEELSDAQIKALRKINGLQKQTKTGG